MNFNQKEIRKLAAGDARMFGALYRIFFPKIHQFALMLLKNKQDADDVCQIIFMKVWLKREDFIGISNLDRAVSTCKCTARKVKEYFRKNTQKGYENLIFLLGDGLFCQQLW